MKCIIAPYTCYYFAFDDFGESGGVQFCKLTPLSWARTTEYLVELVRGERAMSYNVTSASAV